MTAIAPPPVTAAALRPVRLSIPGKYLSLTTYRTDGSPVATPVWFVEDDGRLYVTTAADSYKAKRIRRNPTVSVAPCTARGALRGKPVAAQAAFLPETEYARVDAMMAQKYRLDRILILPVFRLVTWLTRRNTYQAGGEAYLVIAADDHP